MSKNGQVVSNIHLRIDSKHVTQDVKKYEILYWVLNKIFRYKIPKGTNSARFEHIWVNTSSFYKVCSFKFQARLFWEELILYYRFSKYFHVKIHRTLLPGEHFSVSAKIGRYNEILNSLWYGVFAPISRFFCHLGTRHLR